MRDLAEIVEDFKRNIDRIATERLHEIYRLMSDEFQERYSKARKAKLNEILDELAHEAPILQDEQAKLITQYPQAFSLGSQWTLKRLREKIEKL